MAKFFGKAIKGFAKGLDYFISFLIAIIETAVNIVRSLGAAVLSFIGMFGCLLVFLFPVFIIPLLSDPLIWLAFIILVVFPILGTTFVSKLKYFKYSLIEFLNDYGEYLIDDNKKSFGTFRDYADQYTRMKDEKARKEREERQREQQRMWDERFNQWFGGNFSGGYWTNGNQYGYGGYTGQNGYDNSQGHYYQNPLNDFNRQYKEACSILGVSETADKYEVKLAYRKMAKKYHPDINKEPGSKEMFQKVNNAYEFLSDDNIERYRKMN